MTRRQTSSLAMTAVLLGVLLPACDPTEPVPASPGVDASEPGSEPDEVAEPAPGDGEDHDADCNIAPPVHPRVLFLLDKSNSMIGGERESGAVSAGNEPTRWAQLHALVVALAEMAESEAQLGAVLFPSSYAESNRDALCDVRSVPDVAVGATTAAALALGLPPADAEGFFGGSPVQAAYATALSHLESLGAPAPTAIVLVTDGGFNCVDDAALLEGFDAEFVDLVAFARESLQIPTFVVGVDVADENHKLPSINPHLALREIARAGGVTTEDGGYFTAHEPAPLLAAFGEFLAGARAEHGEPACL